eukprot:243573-Pelagomonas_calceolata.AAC.1
MCGIAALLSNAHVSWQGHEGSPAHQSAIAQPSQRLSTAPAQELRLALDPRGPDQQGQCEVV